MRILVFKVALIASFFLPYAALSAADVDSITGTKVVEYFAEKQALGTNVGGIIDANTIWDLAGSPYIVTDSIIIGYNATLTIEAGVVAKLESNMAIVVGYVAFGDGCLVARGTEQSPIIFTSIKDPCDPCDPAFPGDWSRIHFTDYAADASFDPLDPNIYVSGSILEHVIVEYAGHGDFAAIFVEKSSPFLNYCDIRHNFYNGVEVDGTDAPPINIINCEVWDNTFLGRSGIYIQYGSNHYLAYNNIHNNGNDGICLDRVYSSIVTENTAIHNKGQGININYGSGNTLNANTISGNEYGGIYLISTSSNTITGNTIGSNQAGGGITVSYSSSNMLTANTITENTTYSYGGGIWLYKSNGNTFISNSINENSRGAIYLSECHNTTLSTNTITNNRNDMGESGGIYITNDSKWLSLAGDPYEGTYNIIWGNDGYQVYNNNAFSGDGRYDVNACYVDWGTNDPEQIEDGIFDFFDDSSRALVLVHPYVYPGDLNDIWNIKWFCCDFGHENTFDLERDGTPVCGSGNCPGPPGSCWCEPVTKRNGNYPGISWSVGLTGELTLTHDLDFQVYGDTYLYVEVAKTLVVPIISDVGRVWLNDIVIASNTLELTAGFNHLEWTSYNQNQSTTFSLDFPFTCNVDWMGSAPPECGDATDNDEDGLIDYPDDLGCTNRIDISELTGDFNDDRRVDFEDLGILAQYWLQDESSVDIAPLPTGDDIANIQDFAIFAGNWLECTAP